MKCHIFTVNNFAAIGFSCNKHQIHLDMEHCKDGLSELLLSIKVSFYMFTTPINQNIWTANR
jgi:hypothetical protein